MPKNTRLALNLFAIAAGMAMLAYASVPLYRLFCEMTGYGGTPRQVEAAPDRILDKTITVRFNADTDPGLAWEFKPGERSRTARIGESMLTHYIARNLTDQPVTGRATYNVVPHAAGPYFLKVECFCFTEQTLTPNQRVDMPVSFYIDPAIADDPDLKTIETITLSYTFFAVKK